MWQLILDENDIAKFNYNNINAGELSHGIINSGFKCRYYVDTMKLYHNFSNFKNK